MQSSRPYLARALYQWLLDNELTPYIVVDAEQPGRERLVPLGGPQGGLQQALLDLGQRRAQAHRHDALGQRARPGDLLHQRVRVALVLGDLGSVAQRVLFAHVLAQHPLEDGVAQHLQQAVAPVVDLARQDQILAAQEVFVGLHGLRDLGDACAFRGHRLHHRGHPAVAAGGQRLQSADLALYPLPVARWAVIFVAIAFAVVPFTLHEYYVSILNLILVACVGALGLNILVGYTGQISVGHGAFMSVGAYTAANFAVRLDWPWGLNLLLGGLMAAAVGAVVGIPSLRIKGLYLAIATLAGQLIIEWTINHVTFISGGVQASIEVPRPTVFGEVLDTQRDMYYFLLVFVVLAIVGTMNLMRSRECGPFIAIRDQDIAAEIIGINIFRYKLLAFAISSFYAGATGVLYTYFLGIANYEQFQIGVSMDYLAMIIIGGLVSVLGSIFGAIFVTLLPIIIRYVMEAFGGIFFSEQTVLNLIPALRLSLFGVLIIVFLVVEPEGLNRLWRNIRSYFRVWPFAY